MQENPIITINYTNLWRKRWDSNPRYGSPYASFQDWSLQPLGHASLPARRISRCGAGRQGACDVAPRGTLRLLAPRGLSRAARRG